MAIILPNGLTPQEIRVLQEFRRLAAQTLPLPTLSAIKHPSDGGEATIASVVKKGYLTADPAGESFTLTPKAVDFLAIEAKPDVEEPAPPPAKPAV